MKKELPKKKVHLTKLGKHQVWSPERAWTVACEGSYRPHPGQRQKNDAYKQE